MSNFAVYHGMKIRGYQHVRSEREAGRLVFTISQKKKTLRCSSCESANVVSKGKVERLWRSVPWGDQSVFVRLMVPRVLCRGCGLIRQVRVPFADEKVRYTKAFARYALSLSKCTTIQDAADHLDVGWDLIKDIQKRHLELHYAHPKLKHLQRIAIDEIYVGKKQQYLTMVLDLDSGAVVFQGDGKGAEALEPFWKRLRCSGAKIKAVAMDMSTAYQRAVRENLPKAVIVFDHFHIIKLVNDHLTELRRELYHEATEKLHKDVLKGTRWLLLRNPEHLNPKKREPERLQEALKLNESLSTAYYLKEQLRQIWKEPDKRCANASLNDWIVMAECSGIRRMQKLARTIQTYRNGILAWYDHPITTAQLEGTNNKIKTMKRQAYGYRDIYFLKLKIYAIHKAKYALVG